MKAQIVSFHCVLKNRLGQVIGSSFNSEVINQLEKGSQILSGLIEGIQNVKEGEKRQIFVSADRAYGLYDPKLVVEVPRKQLTRGNGLQLGTEVFSQAVTSEMPRKFRVVDTAQDHVVLDGNHPLAGQDLIFEIEITAAREASAEDLGDDAPETEERRLH